MFERRSLPVWAVCTLCLLSCADRTAEPPPVAARNVILMIGDGLGPASATLARDFSGRPLALDAILVGTLRTLSADSLVTDSASSGTAFACGIKTNNLSLAMDDEGRAVGTVLEAAEARGMATGVVVTSRISHATPAAFTAHWPDRWNENAIAEQQVTQQVDLLFGGGRRHFLPQSAGGRREDERDLVAELREAGYQVLASRADLEGELSLPVIGLFSNSHMAYEIDRDPAEQPSLAEMTRQAIRLLAEDPDGFLLIVEGSRIDHAAHSNDPVGHVHDVLAYDAAVAVALEFARGDGRTAVISVADHETGGLAMGGDVDTGQLYNWFPEALAAVNRSTWSMSVAVGSGADVEQVLREQAGIDDPTADELARLREVSGDKGKMTDAFGKVISDRALVGWTTYGHTAVDVNLYAYGPGSEALRGHHDNTDVGRFVIDSLGLDVDAVTRELR